MKEDQDKNKLSKFAQNAESDTMRTETQRQGQTDVRQADTKQAELLRAASPSALRKWMAKKWVFPAVYLAAAAIILSLMWIFQDNSEKALSEEDMQLSVEQSDSSNVLDDEALPVNVNTEEMEWPVAAPELVTIIRPFYDENASNEVKQSAMIRYENMYMPSTGIDIVSTDQDQETFDVLAAMSGTVTRVDQLPLVGNVVEIEHENGLKTVYHSLANVAVEEGAQVIQGEVIAQAGRSEIGKDFGTHLHFEVHKDGEPVNPEHYLPVVAQANALPKEEASADEAESDLEQDAEGSETEDEHTHAHPDADAIGDPDEDPDAGARDSEEDVETELELDE